MSAIAIATTNVGFFLSGRRDLGASLVATRPGPHEATPRLGTPIGLAARLQRGNILGWGAALVVSGLAYGAYTDALTTAFDDLPEVFLELFGGSDDLVAGYLAYMAVFMAWLAGAYTVTAMQSLRSEETSGRAEPVLATPVSRTAWLASNLAVTATAIVVLLAAAGLATGLGAAIVTGDGTHIGEMLLAHLNQVPAVWIVLGVAALLYGILPRAVPAAWVLVAFGLIAGTFGPLLDLPERVLELSPFAHPAAVPLEALRPLPLLALTAIATAGALIGLLTFHRRDLDAT